ncbi:MAG TPA: thiamine pyrophosphate-dependent enzyme, partial [Patescibacteria group bacterium]|nr:thiamine pyrophosphate-dependent enzyme [Patescibacteria group bacterium]
DLINTHTQQDVELDKLFEDVACYNTRIMGAAHVENVTELACRTALSRRSVAHITMPVDMQEEPVNKASRSKRNVPEHVSNILAMRGGVPAEQALRQAAEILNKGHRIVILAGRGAIGAGDILEQIAEKLGAVIAKPLLGKMSVPDDSPYCTGSVGLLGTKPSYDALKECDTLFIVGSSFPYIEFYPKIGQVKSIQLDNDPARIGLRYPADVGLVGDAAKTLQELLPLLKEQESRRFLLDIQKSKEKWIELLEERGTLSDMPMKPQVVAHELNKLLRDDAIILSDSGTIATWYARQIHIRKGQMCTLSGNLATMACGLPYAVGAQIAYPERQVVALVGDGGFTMLMAEMITAKKYNLPIKIVVFKNNELGQIKWEQMAFLGNPEYVCELEPFDFVKYAEACGVAGYRAEDPRTCGDILKTALSTSGPAVIEAVVDPFEPPLPAHIDFSQAKALAESLMRGTPDRGKILKTLAKDTVRELI